MSDTYRLSTLIFGLISRIESYHFLNCSGVSLKPLVWFLATNVSRSGIKGSLANSILYFGSNKCLVDVTNVLPLFDWSANHGFIRLLTTASWYSCVADTFGSLKFNPNFFEYLLLMDQYQQYFYLF